MDSGVLEARARRLAAWFLEVDRLDLDARYWARVAPGAGCWPWRGARIGRGYGALSLGKRRKIYAHRLGYQLADGPLPADAFGCHICDTPSCARPDHVFGGSQADNLADMARKGRWRNRQTRLTAEQVGEIRRRYAAGGVTQRRLASEFGVAQPTISEAITGRTWRYPR